jgi:predicted MFS family arabinose efflux permease
VTATSNSAPPASPRHSARGYPLVPLLGAIFCIDAMTSLVVIAYGNSYLLHTLNAPASYPGYAIGIYGLVKLLSAPVGGWLLDRVRNSVVVAVLLALEVTGLLAVLATNTAAGYLVGVGFLSTGVAIAWLVVFHALGEGSEPTARGTATAYMGLTSAAATASGFGVAALIAETMYWQSAFVTALGLASVSAVFLLRAYPRRPPGGRAQAGTTAATAGLRRHATAGIVVFGHFTVVFATVAAFGPFVLRILDLSLLQAGLVMAPAGAVGAAAMLVAGRRSRHGNRLRELAVLYAIGAGSVSLLAGVDRPWAFGMVAVPLAFAIAGSQPLLNATVLDVSRAVERTGSVLGWLLFVEGLGSVAGPVSMGAGISLIGVRPSIVALGVVEALLVVFTIDAWRRERL